MSDAPLRLVPEPGPPPSPEPPRLRSDPHALQRSFLAHVQYTRGQGQDRATPCDKFQAVSMAVRDRLAERWVATKRAYRTQDAKRAYYLSAEYLLGRALGNNLLATGLLAAGTLAYCLWDARFRASPVHIWSGVAVGLTVVAGWALTGLAFDEMAAKPAPPASLTYVRPTGDALQWLTLFTAAPMPSFGAASVFGALLGACAAALVMGRFRISTFSDPSDTLRNLAGAALMGIGGVMALGCTVGQAITGVSTLALGSILTFAAIVAGGFWGLRILERTV